YAEYVAATPTLMQDSFIKKLRGEYNEEKFLKFQTYLIENKVPIDEKTGLQIMVEGVDKTLNSIEIPVLAIFGEKDSQVDWQETIQLYRETIGKNASLTIETLPNCNHFIRTCETGGYDESYRVLKEKGLGQPCDGYYTTIQSWIKERAF
ncbi:MAG: alpha/beta hydrolase, partial [Bacteroidota bacterium]